MTKKNHPKANIAKALKIARTARKLSQEDFSLVSSRTYISSLERGMKSPTLSKLDELSGVMEIHPLTLLTLAYLNDPIGDSTLDLLKQVSSEVKSIQRP